MIFGQCILTCHNQTNSRIPTEFSDIFTDCAHFSSTPSNRVDVSCQFDCELELQQELVLLKRLIREHDRTSSVLRDAKLLLGCGSPRVLRVLHVRPSLVLERGVYLIPIELYRLSQLSQNIPGLQIQVETIQATAFPRSCFVDPSHLRKFNVIFIDGMDSSRNGLTDLNANLINQSFVEYHRNGGKIVFLHDAIWEIDPKSPRWTYFRDKMGSHTVSCDTGHGYTVVRRKIQSDQPLPILTNPFNLGQSFKVGLTHANQLFAAEKAILVGGDSSDRTYYAESDGIGICEAGHSPHEITDSEWDFLVNVTCNLSGVGNLHLMNK
jgi:hypothetical protein